MLISGGQIPSKGYIYGTTKYDMDEARYNRQNRRSPAEYPPGQQDDFMNDSMFFESGFGSAVSNDLISFLVISQAV